MLLAKTSQAKARRKLFSFKNAARNGTGLTWMGLSILVLVGAFCFLGPLVYHADALTIRIAEIGLPPSATAPLGTDALGRDELSRLMLGGQQIIVIGALAASASLLIGVMAGILAAYFGGVVDVTVSWAVDSVMAIPSLVPLFFLIVTFGANFWPLTAVLSATVWPPVARIARGSVLAVKEELYVEAARAAGAPAWRILSRHVIPNITSVIVVAGTAQFGVAVLLVATASFFGLGLQSSIPNWAAMIAGGLGAATRGQWWLVLFPGLALALLEIAIYVLGDGLRQVLNPKTEAR